MSVFNFKTTHMLVFFSTVSVFFISLFSQILFEKVPCQLCLVTRYIFLSIAVFSLTSIKLKKFRPLLVVAASLAFSFSLYHLGVENHWWAGPQSCISELPTLESFNNAEQLTNNAKSYCDKVNWKIFGVSSTLWSFLFAAFVFWMVSLAYILNYYLGKIENDD